MNLEPLLTASPAIQIHAYAAIAAFLLGGLILFRRKGDRRHRASGRLWVGLMLVVCVSSFFIHELRLWGAWSPIHLLSIGTLFALGWAVHLARSRNIAGHRSAMRSTYLGALVIAGFFTFMPGRIMHDVLFGGISPDGPIALAMTAGVAAALVIAGGAGWAAWRARRSRKARAG